MELRHIRYFLAVAEEGNFTRAAAQIGIGQPPLSQQIKDLETEIGAKLFHRLPHGAELTDAGHAFRDIVGQFPGLALQAVHAAQRAARGEVGNIHVGFTGSAAFNPVVPAAIRAFRRAWPKVRLTLTETNSTRLLASLIDGHLDAAFLRQNIVDHPDIDLHDLGREPMVAVLPSSHPAASRETVPLSMLADDPFILTPREVGPTHFDTVINACHMAGFEAQLGQSAPQFGSMINLVAAELGVSLVPTSMQQLQVRGVVYRPVAGDVPVAYLALAYRRDGRSAVTNNFITGTVKRP
ncbi:LysR family transcriptional regulator [Thalassospira marina]|uniref:LysR family transcriptional regulator n=1 Tax=Thalassospira marina TaxID=2048283 RepID=A0A2N3KEF4_9PROT|nr:LysR family transcriptional regulator [Thalassospira marina]AUG52667.1 LysR family transcriptional regulator [Thalassospira marina]PKR48938.1 LysR family transcriptional regulator [Thalassospira marina]